MRGLALGLVSLLWATGAHAALHTEPIEYQHGEVVLEGFLAYDDATQDTRPGVLEDCRRRSQPRPGA